MLQDVIQYWGEHPAVAGAVVLTIVLALVGLWYVISHHLQVIIITLLCSAGTGSGAVVLFRGISTGMRDLMFIGAFLIAIFPIIFVQAIRISSTDPTRETRDKSSMRVGWRKPAAKS